MSHEQLIALIREHGVNTVGEATRNPIGAAIGHGWNLTRWEARQAPGAVLFVHLDEAGRLDGEPRILCVNEPESERGCWEELIAQTHSDIPVTILMTPGGVVPQE